MPLHSAAGEAINTSALRASRALASPKIVVHSIGAGDGRAVLRADIGTLLDGARGSGGGHDGRRSRGNGSAELHPGGLEVILRMMVRSV